jgi:hypothetical protein
MATTRLMTTVLPYSVDPADRFHVSLFFSHRLDGGGTLSQYPAMVNWVSAVKSATFSLRTDRSANPIQCTPLLQATSENAWTTAFPPTTKVRDYPKPKVTDADWHSFPAHRTPDHALEAHYASACACPVSRPSVLTSPLASEVLDVLGDIEGLYGLVDGLRRYIANRNEQRAVWTYRHDQTARDALQRVKPPPVPLGPVINTPPARPEPAWKSPIEMLFDNEGTDQIVTEYLDDLLTGSRETEGAAQAMLRDVHAAHRYYHREEEQNQLQPQPTPATGVHFPRTPHEAPDFHERVASVCNVPALARKLGLVVDVKVEPNEINALQQATRIWCDVTVANTEKYVSPETLCENDGKRFLAKAEDTNRWNTGRLRLGDPDRYRVMDLDPDAGGLALEQLLRSVIRALAIEVNGDRGSFAPAGLRSTGFALAELARPERLKEQVKKSELLEPVLEQAGPAQPRQQFHFEGLLRGTRVEVWDNVTTKWHSLHDRKVTASFEDKPIFNAVRDTGLLQNPPLSKTPGTANNPYYVHEVLAGWDGWSLSAPRPGKLVIHNDSTHPDPGEERLDNEPEAVKGGLWVRSTVEPGSLPALRYGRRYAFRIAGVDLAGNSVPMDQTPPPDPRDSLIAAAATHLEELRAEAAKREEAGLLASLRAKGMLHPRTLNGNGTRGEVERAMASVVEHAKSLRTHPQWDVQPEQLAALFADSEDPTTVSSPRPFLRWDPIPAPTLVPRVAYTAGESLQRMVIRTGLTAGPGLCQRHIVPPKGSELEAEQDGRLDELMSTGNRARAYAIALKERGSLFHKRIQDLNNPGGTVAQPGIALLAMPNATNLKTLDEIQDPEVQPAEGQYIVHDVDNLVVPYLPDPMANGVALVFYEAGVDHRFANPRVLQSVFVKYAGTWPELQPLRLVLHNAPRLDARQEGNIIHVGLPRGEQVAVKFSTTLDADHLQKMGLWRSHPINDPNVPEADRLVLEQAARNGWLWWLTPDEDLRLVHATARPAIPPRISRLTAKPRARDVVTAALDGVLDVHGASTDKIELRAQWTDPIDDPSASEPTERTTAEVVVDHRIEETERFSLLTLDPDAEDVGARTSEVPIRTAIHNLPDTKARMVKYRLYGSSRYREFFPPNGLPDVGDPESAGNEVEVNIPSSSSPAPPVVHDVIPMFLWEQTTEPEHPFAVRRIRRSGVRIWLDRGWYSSGRGEMLAIITTGDPTLVGVRPETVSLWARDPILVGPKIANSYEVPVLAAWQQRAVQLRLAPESLPGRPALHVVKQGAPQDRDKVVNAYAFVPEFHHERKRWFVDVVLESAGTTWPFLRLALARYQPNSIPGVEFSEIAATDFVQLPPERIGTLSRPAGDHVRISVTGATAVTNAPGLQVPTEPPDRDKLMELLPKSRRVIATLQARNDVSGSDVNWLDLKTQQCELAGVDADTFKATWTAALPLEPPEQLLTPGTFDDLRVQVEEYEILSADPKPGQNEVSATRRLVYADHIYL